MDPLQRQEFRSLLRKLANDHSVLISTHLSEDVAAVADRVCILEQGSMVFNGPVIELAGNGLEVTGSAVEAGFLQAIKSNHLTEKSK